MEGDSEIHRNVTDRLTGRQTVMKIDFVRDRKVYSHTGRRQELQAEKSINTQTDRKTAGETDKKTECGQTCKRGVRKSNRLSGTHAHQNNNSKNINDNKKMKKRGRK